MTACDAAGCEAPDSNEQLRWLPSGGLYSHCDRHYPLSEDNDAAEHLWEGPHG